MYTYIHIYIYICIWGRQACQLPSRRSRRLATVAHFRRPDAVISIVIMLVRVIVKVIVIVILLLVMVIVIVIVIVIMIIIDAPRPPRQEALNMAPAARRALRELAMPVALGGIYIYIYIYIHTYIYIYMYHVYIYIWVHVHTNGIQSLAGRRLRRPARGERAAACARP